MEDVANMLHVFKELHVDLQVTDDKLIWMPTSDSGFSVKSAWKVISTSA